MPEPSTRRIVAAVGSTLPAATLVLAAPGPAMAETLDATCTGSTSVTYTPGLLLTERDVSVSGQRTYECLSASVTSGTSSFSLATAPRGCLSVTPSSSVERISWNDGSESVVTAAVTTVNVGGTTIVTKNGTVTSGRFVGDLVLQVITGPTISGLLACLAPPGLTAKTDTVVLKITSMP